MTEMKEELYNAWGGGRERREREERGGERGK